MNTVNCVPLGPLAQQQLDQLMHWHQEVSMLGITRFGELGWRMTELMESLGSVPEASGMVLGNLQRMELENLIAKLHANEPPFSNWDEPLQGLMRILGIERHSHQAH